MPFQNIESFGTAAWFDQISLLPSTVIPNLPRFVIEHQAIESHNKVIVHQQIFSQNELVCWVPGRAIQEPDMILIRSAECDKGDLLGRIPASDIITRTAVIIQGQKSTCVLGIANMRRPGLQEVIVGTVDVYLEALGTPFGDADFAIRLNQDGSQQVIKSSEADSDITLFLHWDALTEWIHTDTGLGHLINSGAIEFEGPMFKLSYIEGHICWPRHPQDKRNHHRFKTAMDTYAELRRSPSYLRLMDEIDAATPP
ncbi:MAG: hypothetical protein OXF00_10985 [bacterium]|nr:hypothetical protein [bacterium]